MTADAIQIEGASVKTGSKILAETRPSTLRQIAAGLQRSGDLPPVEKANTFGLFRSDWTWNQRSSSPGGGTKRRFLARLDRQEADIL